MLTKEELLLVAETADKYPAYVPTWFWGTGPLMQRGTALKEYTEGECRLYG